MKVETIYILHKNGANNHYLGLSYLCKNQNIKLVYREFSVISKLIKSITKLNKQLFAKQLKNSFFLIQLLFSQNKKIVIGIAPYDSKLKRLLWLLNRHQVYYHTSWPYWDKTFQPKRLKKNSKSVLKVWKKFLENNCKHIFTVTETAKNNLLQNYSINRTNISAVYHSISDEYLNTPISIKSKTNNFIYVGRLTPEKGIQELIDIFSNHKEIILTIVGDGKLKDLVIQKSLHHKNINYINFLKNKTLLARYFQDSSFLILNSKKTKKWEELFGMVIIEGMSQGVIPIASNHAGPKEIINEMNGFLFEEGKLENKIEEIIENQYDIIEMKKKCIEFSKKFTAKKNADRWLKILE